MRNFTLNQNQELKLSTWINEQDKKVMEEQNKNKENPRNHPYYGCSGGEYTYSFTPTSLGTIRRVTNNYTKESIDLTEYGDW